MYSSVVRAAFFKDLVQDNDSKPLELDAIHSAIKTYYSPTKSHNWLQDLTWHSFVHQYDEEFNALKKERRAGRPPSTREDLLKIKIATDEKEYETGFCRLKFYSHWILQLITDRPT